MKRVLTAVVLAPLVLLAVFRAPLWLFALLVAAVIVLALHEYLHIAEAAGLKPFKWLTYVISLLPFVLMWLNGWPVERQISKVPFNVLFLPNWLFVLMATAVILGIPLVFRKDLTMGLASVAASVFGVIYIAGSLSLLFCMRGDQFDKILVIFVLFSVWAGDIAAYYVGRSLGKHKLAPIVSPKKSWEGAIASVMGSVAVAALVFHFQPQISQLFVVPPQAMRPRWISIVGLGILTNVAAQFGDLFESALKRGANLKDSGTLLPGHGGVLDRIDALLFAIPVVWYYANLTGFLNKTFQ
ncbi:MAG TPA: phosphatidate cytidylyltransferase [Candidatus Angelobacter sp.]|nr:phosphatidate cytidylyltransferase [Candidatus Angelobacter sp.]